MNDCSVTLTRSISMRRRRAYSARSAVSTSLSLASCSGGAGNGLKVSVPRLRMQSSVHFAQLGQLQEREEWTNALQWLP